MEKEEKKYMILDSSSDRSIKNGINQKLKKLIPEKDHPVWELIKFAALALLIVVPIRTFIAQPFIVSGSSMVPAFEDKQYIIVDQITYKFKAPERGDVVIFKYPKDPSKFFIKRIIGLPGETVQIYQDKVTIKNKENPEGFTLDEYFVQNKSINYLDYIVKDNEYYVMGDNRASSSDSRIWGPLPKNLITGRALIRLLPINTIGLLPGKITYGTN